MEIGHADGRTGCRTDAQALELWAQVLSRPEPGDLVCLGISHPCTTLDKWRVIPVVSDDGRVTDTVHAFF